MKQVREIRSKIRSQWHLRRDRSASPSTPKTSKVTTALNAAKTALNIATESADGVPIVKKRASGSQSIY